MDQSSWDDTLVDVGPSRPFPRDAVSCQSSWDKSRKRSLEKTSRREGRAIRGGMLPGRIAQTVHAYPTWSIAVRQAAAQWFVGLARPAGPNPSNFG